MDKKKVLISVGVSLLLLEVVSCGYYRKAIPKNQRVAVELMLGLTGSDSHTVSRYQAHPYFNYVGAKDYQFKNGDSAHNSDGFRAQEGLPNPPNPERLRLAAIGASTTYGMYFGKASSVWPAQLTQRLADKGIKADSVSLALPAYSTFELLGVTAMMVPDLKPDWVLIHTGMNDAFAVGFRDEGGPDNRYFRHDWSFSPPGALTLAGMRWSKTVRVLVMRSLPNLGDMITAMQFAAPKGEELATHMKAANGRYFRRNLTSLVALVRSFGAKPLLINMSLNPGFEQRRDPYQAGVAAAVSRNNRIMAEVGSASGTPVVDLYKRLRDSKLFLDAVHVNQAGMAIKAQAISDALVTAMRPPPPPPPVNPEPADQPSKDE